MRILFIVTREPTKTGKADQVTTYHAIEFLQRNGIEVNILVLSRVSIWQIPVCILRSFLTATPMQVELYRSRRNNKAILKSLKSQNFDKVYLHLIRSAAHIGLLQKHNIYLGMQVSQYLNFSRTSKELNFGLKKLVYFVESMLCKSYERRIIQHVQKINFVGTRDSEFINYPEGAYCKISTVAHGVDAHEKIVEEKTHDLVFLANFASEPNRIALKHLIRDIMKIVWDTQPDVTLTVAGRNIPSWVYTVENERLSVIGEVDSAHDCIGKHRVFVNAVRASAGMQNKVLTSLIAGTPVVTYATAVEGMNLKNDLVLEAESDVLDLANHIINILAHYPTQESIKTNAKNVAQRWCWDVLHREWIENFLGITSGE